jgi:hypothetical protein
VLVGSSQKVCVCVRAQCNPLHAYAAGAYTVAVGCAGLTAQPKTVRLPARSVRQSRAVTHLQRPQFPSGQDFRRKSAPALSLPASYVPGPGGRNTGTASGVGVGKAGFRRSHPFTSRGRRARGQLRVQTGSCRGPERESSVGAQRRVGCAGSDPFALCDGCTITSTCSIAASNGNGRP